MLRTKPDTGTAHTPGPWEYESGWLYHRGKSPTGTGYSDTILKIDDPVWQPSEADARLITAAPELAAMVRDLLKIHEAHHNHPTHGAARRLLSKAEGGQP